MSLQEGKVLSGKAGRYELLRVLGEGGFGISWLGRRTEDGREVVIKKLRMERVEQWKAVELFERESQVLSDLNHPRIPDYIDHFTLETEAGTTGFALVQEYVEGRTLRQIWSQGIELSEEQMLRWFLGSLEVLDYLHQNSGGNRRRRACTKMPLWKRFMSCESSAMKSARLSSRTCCAERSRLFKRNKLANNRPCRKNGPDRGTGRRRRPVAGARRRGWSTAGCSCLRSLWA